MIIGMFGLKSRLAIHDLHDQLPKHDGIHGALAAAATDGLNRRRMSLADDS